MMRRWLIALPLLLAFGGCSSLFVGYWADKARSWAVGRTPDQLAACMGIPKTEKYPPNITIAQWDFKTQGTSTEIPIAALGDLAVEFVALPFSLSGAGSVSFSGNSQCSVMATFTPDPDGTLHVRQFRYSGDADGIGADAGCGYAVRNCMREAGQP